MRYQVLTKLPDLLFRDEFDNVLIQSGFEGLGGAYRSWTGVVIV